MNWVAVAHSFNPSIREVETGRPRSMSACSTEQALGEPGLHRSLSRETKNEMIIIIIIRGGFRLKTFWILSLNHLLKLFKNKRVQSFMVLFLYYMFKCSDNSNHPNLFNFPLC